MSAFFCMFIVMNNLNILKEDLIARIQTSKNEELIRSILDLFSNQKSKHLTFSKEEREMLLLSEEDIKCGRTISNEELQKRDSEWM